MSRIDDILYFEEGYREHVYYDSEGFPTIGIGKRIGEQYAPLSHFTFTVSLEVAKFWVKDDCKEIIYNLENDARTEAAWSMCNEPRQDMLISMAYQLGFDGLCDFDNMLAALELGDFEQAHNEMLQSVWHSQTEARCEREADVMLEGTYDPYQEYLH